MEAAGIKWKDFSDKDKGFAGHGGYLGTDYSELKILNSLRINTKHGQHTHHSRKDHRKQYMVETDEVVTALGKPKSL